MRRMSRYLNDTDAQGMEHHPAQSPQKVVSSKDARGHSLEWPSLIGSARRWGESA